MKFQPVMLESASSFFLDAVKVLAGAMIGALTHWAPARHDKSKWPPQLSGAADSNFGGRDGR
jgi:hypothetical protein